MASARADATAAAWRDRFDRLGQALAATRAYWHPSPFRGVEPPWCAARPELLQRLGDLGAPDREIPLAALGDLIAEAPIIDELSTWPLPPPRRDVQRPVRADWGVPGRKQAQLEALVGAMGEPCGDLIDWCGGKGHLGRCLARQFDRPVVTLDVDQGLLDAAVDLADRARVTGVSARRQDALADVLPALAGKHVVALHACGELHRRLVREVSRQHPAALDIAPCCYAKGVVDDYVPLARAATLTLQADDLRLAVTGAVTSSAAEQTRRRRSEAWKSGLRLLLAEQGAGHHALACVPANALAETFAHFCRTLAGREGITLSDRAAGDWAAAEQAGWQASAAIARRNALRLAFAPALEAWLVLDLAVALAESGYTVELAHFCRRELTPRNLLLSARRAD